MRQRKRADWPISVYQYWVRLAYHDWSHLPEGAKREIDAMRALWNELVDAFEQRQAEYRQVLSLLPHIAEVRGKVEALQRQLQQADASCKTARQRLRQQRHPDLVTLQEAKHQAQKAVQEARVELQEAQRTAADSVRPALRQLQESFFAEARRLTATCPATWADRAFILNQFLAAVHRFFKRQSRPPKRKLGIPQEVHFQHQFTSGGLPVDRIFGRGQRLHLEPVPPEAFNSALSQRQRKRLARTAGTFQVGDSTLSFETLLHRPLPGSAYLKTAALVGRQIVRRGYRRDRDGGHTLSARWAWSLHLTLEIPPQAIPVQETTASGAALHLGYRLWGDGQLCIGVLIDATGREEALFLPEDILKSWQYKRDLQSRADRLVEETKGRLRRLRTPENLPRAAQTLFNQVGTLRAAGLWQLLALLEETSATNEALEIVRHWADRSTTLLREARGLERRYLSHRDWFYHNLALQLCQRYRRLVVAAPDLSPMAAREREENNPRLQEVATYRQLASLSRFMAFLRQAAAKTGTELEEVQRASAMLIQDPVQRGKAETIAESLSPRPQSIPALHC